MIPLLHRLNEAEIPLCLFFNRMSHVQLINRFFATISRLGDGIFWYVLMLILPPLYGVQGLEAALHMLLTSTVVLGVYKLLKTNTHRIRPFHYDEKIFQNVPALDQFSFPSGHTMHAVSFSIVLLSYFPQFAWLVIPFTFFVALSRVVLGLHYPSDVIAGVLLGTFLAIISLTLT
ncbi:MAG: Phosphoesterase PA-phosphatase related protein [uncultured Thiotrichaceae bacterium]|uniref:undecaprenyl-diphosphate phosphatase n=1 Tax=uncultured Thiotrichaceae bacterium TaxID=298394 RepID=A0A6S6SW22_9GAMM|nr:MAG: Phosphoesterase PA-phosphatase related protein [uncultured Thiotrichaceae bacterium]